MKLCREMLEAMGGLESEHYLKFKSYCFTAFSTLRKSAHLIINLFELMRDATIPAMVSERGTTILKVGQLIRDIGLLRCPFYHIDETVLFSILHGCQFFPELMNSIFFIVIG